jgi:hypothetical protein
MQERMARTDSQDSLGALARGVPMGSQDCPEWEDRKEMPDSPGRQAIIPIFYLKKNNNTLDIPPFRQ